MYWKAVCRRKTCSIVWAYDWILCLDVMLDLNQDIILGLKKKKKCPFYPLVPHPSNKASSWHVFLKLNIISNFNFSNKQKSLANILNVSQLWLTDFKILHKLTLIEIDLLWGERSSHDQILHYVLKEWIVSFFHSKCSYSMVNFCLVGRFFY